MNSGKEWLFKIIICVTLSSMLFYAIGDHPYSSYMTLRLACTVGYITLAVIEKKNVRWLWVGLAVLFNPIFKVHLTKDTWQIVDGIGGAIILGFAVYEICKIKKGSS